MNEALFQWETFRTTEFTWIKMQDSHHFCAVFENSVHDCSDPSILRHGSSHTNLDA